MLKLSDADRGVDVLKIDGGGATGKKGKAPVRSERFGSGVLDNTSFSSSFERTRSSGSSARC